MGWISIREAAERLGVSRRTIRRMITAGTLPSQLKNGIRLVLLKEASKTGIAPDQNLLECLFDIYEDFELLAESVLEILTFEKTVGHLFDNLPGQEGRLGFEKWAQLYVRIENCHNDIERLVWEIRLDSNIIQKTYREIVKVRRIWTRYSQWNVDPELDNSQDRPNEKSTAGDPLAIMNQVVTNLRKLLIERGGQDVTEV